MRTSIRASAFALALACALTTASIGAQPAAINPQETIPFDAAVHRGTLPNGLQFFIRQNARPAKRVLLRLAVKAG
jgi:zinc protease